jgi:hypothetical protein
MWMKLATSTDDNCRFGGVAIPRRSSSPIVFSDPLPVTVHGIFSQRINKQTIIREKIHILSPRRSIQKRQKPWHIPAIADPPPSLASPLTACTCNRYFLRRPELTTLNA